VGISAVACWKYVILPRITATTAGNTETILTKPDKTNTQIASETLRTEARKQDASPKDISADTNSNPIPKQEVDSTKQGTRLEPNRRVESTLGRVVDMASKRLLLEKDLDGHTAWELTIMRNAPYARQGYQFGNLRIARFFQDQTWYRPVTNDMRVVEQKLSSIEKKNVVLIAVYQDKHHLRIQTQPANSGQ
jgi:hypothetical protein